MKKCPYCAEEIQNEAIKCRHCGEMINGPKIHIEKDSIGPFKYQKDAIKKKSRLLLVVVFIAGLIGAIWSYKTGMEAIDNAREDGIFGQAGKELTFGQKISAFVAGVISGNSIGISPSDSTLCVSIVKKGHFLRYPNEEIGKTFRRFFSSPSWRYFCATDGRDIVEFNGKALLNDMPVNVKIQFIVDKKSSAFDIIYFSINDIPQDLLTFTELLSVIYGIK